MSLFEVPGWSVPSAPVSQTNKKRKRPTAKDSTDDVDEAARMHSAQKNIEKLMKSLGAGMDTLGGEDAEPPVKRKRDGKEKRAKGVDRGQKLEEERVRKSGIGTETEEARQGGNKTQKTKSKKGDTAIAVDRPQDQSTSSPAKSKKQKQKQKQKHARSADIHSETGSTQDDAPTASAATVSTPQLPTKKAGNRGKHAQDGMTALQAKMKSSLDGARFRWINEMFYKSDSGQAHELMSQDPAVFADYHTGFRHQVESWPTNPVSHYVTVLSSYPVKTVIADLGCGDAALARSLVLKGMSVLSFDLVSDDAYVIKADICSHVPLPGSEPVLGEPSLEGDGEGQVVDVVVCALSLMGTNWPGCIREAWRILRPGGELKIAEVTSRFVSTDEFTSFVSSFGFKLKSKDERNTHFALFEFKKVPRKPKTGKDWEKLLSRGNILKPCEYKRR
ncbi:methyltransferase-domain-containing protein [Ganoderma leucocontextum]|nr:methyltransferase-domain-containing protein [Ganoderma leucocontextum]